MPILRNEQRLILAVGILLFLLSCAYVPWECRYYQSVGVQKTGAEPYLEYHLGAPSNTRYGWVFQRPVAPTPIFGGGVEMSAEVNIQFLVVEWLGISLFTGALMWLLKPPAK